MIPNPDFNGPWYNELHSEMQLTVGADRKLTGRYRTGAGAPKPDEWFPLTGFVSGDLIVFTVNFGKYASLTAWAGQVAGDPPNERIQTLWHLARNIPDPKEPDELWEGLLAGADVFTRQPPPAPARTRRLGSHPMTVGGEGGWTSSG